MNSDRIEALGNFIATERDKYPRRGDDMDSWDLAEAIAGSDWLAAVIRQAQAEALEEAGKEWRGTAYNGFYLILHDRATAIRQEGNK